MKNALIVGATSGIGKELAFILAENGYTVCITGRRRPKLEQLLASLPDSTIAKEMDVRDTSNSIDLFNDILAEMTEVDLVILSAGTGSTDPALPWSEEQDTIETNVTGFTALANAAYQYFLKRQSGHLVGISSIAAIRGGPAPAYNASKAYVSSYLEGLRCKIGKTGHPVFITDIQPGFVDTEMAKGDGLFWVQPPRKAAEQIYAAIAGRKKKVYITKRWGIIAWTLKWLPDFIYHKL